MFIAMLALVDNEHGVTSGLRGRHGKQRTKHSGITTYMMTNDLPLAVRRLVKHL